jgi:hypothetical protein
MIGYRRAYAEKKRLRGATDADERYRLLDIFENVAGTRSTSPPTVRTACGSRWNAWSLVAVNQRDVHPFT